MLLINWEINLILTWSVDSAIFSGNVKGKFQIKATELYVPIVTLSAQDNANLLQQLKSGFLKKTINCNKYQTKVSTEGLNQYKDFLID